MSKTNIVSLTDEKSQNVEKGEIPSQSDGSVLSRDSEVSKHRKRDVRFKPPIRVQVTGQPKDIEIEIHVIKVGGQTKSRRGKGKLDKDLRAPQRVAILSGSRSEVRFHATKDGIQAKIKKTSGKERKRS